MFASAESGLAINREEFDRTVTGLRTKLLAAQRALGDADFPVILLISGIEAAGKSAVINRLYEWMDARGIQTATLWRETDEERERPLYWRYWRRLPPKGRIGLFFGSWYTHAITQHTLKQTDRSAFEKELTRIADFEQMLARDGALILKLWLHIEKDEQAKRIAEISKSGSGILTRFEHSFAKDFDLFLETSETAIRRTDTTESPWHVIDASDPLNRDMTAGKIVLEALQTRLKKTRQPSPVSDTTPINDIRALSKVALTEKTGKKEFNTRLAPLQARINALTWRAYEEKRSTVAVFEGWDAAGKGGAIRRVTAAMDARLFRVIPIAAPSDEEGSHHYLWRFWRHLPMDGAVTIFDRSWYGRVLVERVEGFAKPEEWYRAYSEINSFEQQLADHGIRLMKFWLHISPDEQLKRFESRKDKSYKRHKLTEEDWRNREKWQEYEQAVNDMICRTSTDHSPWTLVPANCKRHARLTVLRTFCKALE